MASGESQEEGLGQVPRVLAGVGDGGPVHRSDDAGRGRGRRRGPRGREAASGPGERSVLLSRLRRLGHSGKRGLAGGGVSCASGDSWKLWKSLPGLMGRGEREHFRPLSTRAWQGVSNVNIDRPVPSRFPSDGP